MSMYKISSNVNIASIVYRFLTLKQIADKYFSKIFSIYIPILIKRVLS